MGTHRDGYEVKLVFNPLLAKLPPRSREGIVWGFLSLYPAAYMTSSTRYSLKGGVLTLYVPSDDVLVPLLQRINAHIKKIGNEANGISPLVLQKTYSKSKRVWNEY